MSWVPTIIRGFCQRFLACPRAGIQLLAAFAVVPARWLSDSCKARRTAGTVITGWRSARQRRDAAMSRIRYRLSVVMGFIASVGVGLAALKSSTELAASIIFSVFLYLIAMNASRLIAKRSGDSCSGAIISVFGLLYLIVFFDFSKRTDVPQFVLSIILDGLFEWIHHPSISVRPPQNIRASEIVYKKYYNFKLICKSLSGIFFMLSGSVWLVFLRASRDKPS